jgi:hypothetical protein
MSSVRDFDPTQLAADYLGILDQAGITFTYQGNTVTGIWSSARNAFDDFEDQRRADSKFTIFLTTDQIATTPAVSQTLLRSGVTYFVERVTLDAEGTGCEIDVCKNI